MTNQQTILINSGTGSLGKALTRDLLDTRFDQIKKLIIFSRDEQEQYQMEMEFSKEDNNKLRFLIGDVRDLDR